MSYINLNPMDHTHYSLTRARIIKLSGNGLKNTQEYNQYIYEYKSLRGIHDCKYGYVNCDHYVKRFSPVMWNNLYTYEALEAYPPLKKSVIKLLKTQTIKKQGYNTSKMNPVPLY
jgi:hypothetical protein